MRGQRGSIPTASRHDLLPLRLELDADASSVAVARSQLSRIAAECGAHAAGVELCVSEAVSNAVIHAYRRRDRDDGEPPTVRVAADVEDGFLRVIVEDDGVGPVPRHDSPGLGIGLSLIAAIAWRAEISSRSPSGARVCMRFPTGGQARG